MGGILGGGDGGAKKAAKAAQASANQAADATIDASKTYSNSIGGATAPYVQGIQEGTASSVLAQQDALRYLQQADSLPTGLREDALRSLGSLYNGQGSITDRAMASPLYQAAVQQGENSVLRNASATGGLRSGTASENLANVNQNALIAAYNDQIQGLQGLSALPSNANNIAGYMAGIGNTYGQGQMAAGQAYSQGQLQSAQALYQGQTDANNFRTQGAQAAAQTKAQGAQNSANNTTALIGMGLTAAMMMSDRRLKKNIEFTGEEKGIRKYRWIWNDVAARLGLSGPAHGVMADEVEESNPEAVSIQDGYLIVDYSKLGVSYGV